MIEKGNIEKIVKDFTAGTGMFLVSVKVSGDNRISVLADTMTGIRIEDCVALHRHIENSLDRDAEDFELQVSSPGLDAPFTVPEQYHKNNGKKIEVTTDEGIKTSGILKNITAGGFELDTEVKVKGKPKEIRELSFNFEQVKTAKLVITI
jgi:ribosome maturation factor RimP